MTSAGCDRHDRVPAGARCCLDAGHPGNCVPAGAHVHFWPEAVVLSLPASHDRQAAMRRASMIYASQVLEAAGFTGAADFLRDEVKRMRRSPTRMARASSVPGATLGEIRRRDEGTFQGRQLGDIMSLVFAGRALTAADPTPHRGVDDLDRDRDYADDEDTTVSEVPIPASDHRGARP